MMRCSKTLLAGLCLAALAVSAHAVVLTGEVRAIDAQQILTPQSNSSPVVIRYYVPEGERVKKGDVVLRIDPGQSASRIPDLEAEIEQTLAKNAKDVAELQVKAVQAETELVDAEAELATAKLDARIPRELISALDYDRYQGDLDRTTREAALKRKQLDAARAAVQRATSDGQLQVRKLELERDYHTAMVRTSEVKADRDGVVVHGFNNNWIGGRIDEGSSTMPGSKAGEVVSSGRMNVRAWALEPDRRDLKVGQPVELSFDALPGKPVPGRIEFISGAPERRPEWGEGRYFTVDVTLDSGSLALMPGMSVRVIARPPAATANGGRGR
ncbi:MULTISPECIES: HlyD family efflux transporter periplasmic adaptor subunit [unclassified Pseudoxanthomonas]|uniref:HlyD family secretion protein n=1 Tax=unclassified Pseudoxanthomonas TaxID=2645906 RepID=UPI00161263E5|nr:MULTISPECIES: HlyD family efflux transporter periplasmic adaptor subunit [unclassified Pseudoxanthomonas]MBB3276699.1 multidrug resistance efflux pump [Pseudoxanthomonas sp. OG2]MBV7472228.1 HlyD family efflux transporter periplasmic adaptor subunit [Pseudoxanthomonas sp. PXM05]